MEAAEDQESYRTSSDGAGDERRRVIGPAAEPLPAANEGGVEAASAVSQRRSGRLASSVPARECSSTASSSGQFNGTTGAPSPEAAACVNIGELRLRRLRHTRAMERMATENTCSEHIGGCAGGSLSLRALLSPCTNELSSSYRKTTSKFILYSL